MSMYKFANQCKSCNDKRKLLLNTTKKQVVFCIPLLHDVACGAMVHIISYIGASHLISSFRLGFAATLPLIVTSNAIDSFAIFSS